MTRTNTAPSRSAHVGIPAGITHEIVMVTPVMASRWLEDNTHNRNRREGVVKAYARDLEAGKWDFNGETIKFAADGTLLDGQHRLLAIVRAKTAAPCLVVRGLPRSAQKTIDNGATRKFADQLGLDGEATAQILSSILRKIALWEAGYRGHAGHYRPTVAELEDTLVKHPSARDSAIFGTAKNRGAGMYASQLGFGHWLLSEVDVDDAAWFMERICDGAELHTGHPVLAFRERIRREREISHGRLNTEVALALLITAWNAYRSGNTLTKVQLPKGGLSPDNFPKPR